MPRATPLVVEHAAEEVPELPLADHLLAADGDALLVLDVDRLVATDLLVERVEELLPGGRAGERRAVEERAAEATEVEQALGRAVERHAHAVEHVDDAGRRVGHALDGRLVREEVAAVDRLLEVDLGRVAFALRVHARVDAALRAHRVRALDGNEREEVDGNARLAELDHGREAREAAADDDDAPDLSGFGDDAARLCHGALFDGVSGRRWEGAGGTTMRVAAR